MAGKLQKRGLTCNGRPKGEKLASPWLSAEGLRMVCGAAALTLQHNFTSYSIVSQPVVVSLHRFAQKRQKGCIDGCL